MIDNRVITSSTTVSSTFSSSDLSEMRCCILDETSNSMFIILSYISPCISFGYYWQRNKVVEGYSKLYQLVSLCRLPVPSLKVSCVKLLLADICK